jgi:hypothetical protein
LVCGGFGNDNWNFVHWKQEKFSKKRFYRGV